MLIRQATIDDWPALAAMVREVIAEGRTIAYPEDLSDADARDMWLPDPPYRSVVAVASPDGPVLGSAWMGPNRPGRGNHVATATFVVSSSARGQGVGRALGGEVMAWARDDGYHGIQFNAVVETNAPAVHLWQELGMRIIGTVPRSFRHPVHGLVGMHVMYQQFDPIQRGD